MGHMSYSQHFLHNLLDISSLFGTISEDVLNYKRDPMSTVKGPLIGLILTVAQYELMRDARSSSESWHVPLQPSPWKIRLLWVSIESCPHPLAVYNRGHIKGLLELYDS